MFFTRPCQYAIRALVHLAASPQAALCQVQEIAAAETLPAPTLAGILKNLARAGLVQSRKGPHGGFCLARPAEHITLYQIMLAVGHTEMLSQCVVGFATCSDQTLCPVHDCFTEVRQRLIEGLQTVTVAALVTATAHKRAQARPETAQRIDIISQLP